MCLACNNTFVGVGDKCPNDGTQLVTVGHDENIGRLINDRFKVIELVGKGGMGAVYLAEDLARPKTWVAIKMLHAQLSEDKVSVKRFQQEASAASDLRHPNLIEQYDYGMIDDKQPYLVMEYLVGDSLSEVIRENGPINPVRCARIFAQCMDGLQYAHDKGVVHRDIKPSNILLVKKEGAEDQVKVLDFGLAKLMPWSGKESQHLTKTGEVFGSPIYMSPEQCMGKKLEPSSDIYSLGITLYEALTGKPPFKGQNVVQTASKHLSDAPPPFDQVCPELNLPQNLQNVVFKALEKDTPHRFLDMKDFKEALVYAVTGQGVASARTQAVMAADATQPVKKVDLEGLKASAQNVTAQRQAAENAKKQVPVGLIAGGLVALAVVGGGIFFMTGAGGGKSGNSPVISLPHDCKGTVTYIDVRTVSKKGKRSNRVKEVHINTEKGLVKLSSDVSASRPWELTVGKIWQVNYKGDDKSGELQKYTSVGENGDVIDADNLVTNFFAQLADQAYIDAFQMMSDNYIKKNYKGLSEDAALKKFTEIFKKESYQNYRNGNVSGKQTTEQSFPAMQVPDGSDKAAPQQSTKVMTISPEEITVMINTDYFYTRPHGFEVFTVVKTENGWRIDSIKAGSSEADWNSY